MKFYEFKFVSGFKKSRKRVGCGESFGYGKILIRGYKG